MSDPVHHPEYYKAPMTSAKGLSPETVDIAEAFFADNIHLATAFIYIARAGRKSLDPNIPDAEMTEDQKREAYIRDVEKAIWWLTRAKDFVVNNMIFESIDKSTIHKVAERDSGYFDEDGQPIKNKDLHLYDITE